MSEWTDSARKLWAEYISKTGAALDGTGADAQEVLDDLRRHVDEEAVAAKLNVVTEEDLRKILAKIGPAEAANSGNVKQTQPEAPPGPTFDARPMLVGGFLFFFGILLPVITILFEWFTGASADVLFDPIPTWFHIVIVALVPIGNAWLWIAAWRRLSKHSQWLGWLNGFVLGVCIYYSFLYILFVPFACMAVVWFGLGLIPLTPYLTLIATPVLRRRYCRAIGVKKLPGLAPAASLAIIGLLMLQLPESLTYYGLSCARSDDKATQLHGINVLRVVGNRTIMLRACYGALQYRETFQPINLLATGNNPRGIDSDFARETFYRVTGEAFNAVPPPKFYTRAGAWTEVNDEYTWDDGLGGDQVAGRIKGLSLLSSRMDATTEPDAGIGYCEWIMEFKNVSAVQREARAQIALPPGAVVSRVTMWIDGEEREAAFGGRSQVRTAYKEEAVQHRHDPLLVTTCGTDRVLVQCFPIQPNGGVMKIRIGITAPLILDSLSSGNFVWPHFLERNFGIAADFKHSLWLEQPGQNNRMEGTHENLSETNLSTSPHATPIHRHADIQTVWTPAETPGRIVQQTIRVAQPSPPARIVLVLDGSAGMKRFAPDLARALDEIPQNSEMAVVVASDESEPVAPEIQKASPATKAELQRKFRHLKFSGGQDNLPALETAWDLADASDAGDVIWIHLPEPFELSSDSGICQRLERNLKHTRLHEIQLTSGPDRIVEKLDGLPYVEHVISFIPDQTGLDHLLNLLSGRSQMFAFDRQLLADPDALPANLRTGKHLLRLWARDEAERLDSHRQHDEAVKLAAQNQLVTSFTGAVVLETKAQYDRHNLSPADPSTVPTIPEPGDLALLAFGFLALYLLKRKFGRDLKS